MRACQSFGGGPAERVGVTLYTHCPDGARLLCGDAPRGAMLGAPLVATTSEGRTMLVGVLSSDATAGGVSDTPGGVSDTPRALRFADVGAARAWILAASGLIRPNQFFFHFLATKTSARMRLVSSIKPFVLTNFLPENERKKYFPGLSRAFYLRTTVD